MIIHCLAHIENTSGLSMDNHLQPIFIEVYSTEDTPQLAGGFPRREVS